MAAQAGQDDGESFVEFDGAVVGGQGGRKGTEPGEMGDGQPVQSEAAQVVGLVGVQDLFLQFVQDVAVEEPGEQTGRVQRAGLVEPSGAEQLDLPFISDFTGFD